MPWTKEQLNKIAEGILSPQDIDRSGQITWAAFKRNVESNGVVDNDFVDWIDWSGCAGGNVTVRRCKTRGDDTVTEISISD